MQYEQFSRLCDVKMLEQYMRGRSRRHTAYRHFTLLNVLNNIMEKKQIWVSCVNGFNDVKDMESFGKSEDERRFIFSLCFSTGTHENLALWYLYSGTDGYGACIEWTKSQILKLVENGKYYLYTYDKANKKLLRKIKELSSDDMQIEFEDVLYFDEEKSGVFLKYNTMTNKGKIDAQEFELYRGKNKGFMKNLIWYYEKETRLLVRLREHFSETLQRDEDYIIVLNFEDLKRFQPKIVLAPGHKDWSLLKECSYILQYMRDTSKVGLSLYHGDVDMKLESKLNFK